ncbi:hypothetical protein COP1_026925 [Malus domestica]
MTSATSSRSTVGDTGYGTVYCCMFILKNYREGATLGGTGKETGDRHPKIGDGALIRASVTILGNIKIGRGAMVAAGSLVLKDVPPHSMVAGIPVEVIGYVDEIDHSLTMKHDVTKEFFEHVVVRRKDTRPAGWCKDSSVLPFLK